MPRDATLNEQALEMALSALSAWSLRKDKLHREFLFDDFSEAFAFMTRAALAAEQLDHHPEWSNVYNRVTVDLTTHDSGGITERDITLATKMEEFAQASTRRA